MTFRFHQNLNEIRKNNFDKLSLITNPSMTDFLVFTNNSFTRIFEEMAANKFFWVGMEKFDRLRKS